MRGGRFLRLAAALVPYAALAGCLFGGGGGGPAAQPPAPTRLPPPLPLYYDNGGGIRDSIRVVIREPAVFEDYWFNATMPQASPPPAPIIDFTDNMVIVVAAGRATPEEEIHVDSLLVQSEMNAQGEREETLTIVVRTVLGCGRFRTEAFPLEIVRVRRFSGPVRWQERRQQIPCGSVPETPPAAVSPEAYPARTEHAPLPERAR
jgi:hypothetical protein